jgi:hypothetical protein
MKQVFTVAVALAALVAVPALSQAQAKPDFSGSWTLNQEKSDPAPARGGGGGGGGGRGGGRGGGVAAQMSIKQTPAQLSIDRTMGQGNQTAVYKLDGSESTNTIGPGEAKSKAMWDGAKLAITTSQTMQGRGGGDPIAVEVKEIYSLDGGALTIERTQTTPAGATTRKLVYDKSM